MEYENTADLDEYIARFQKCNPDQILQYLGEMRDFLYDAMTPEGRVFFERTRHGGNLEDSLD